MTRKGTSRRDLLGIGIGAIAGGVGAHPTRARARSGATNRLSLPTGVYAHNVEVVGYSNIAERPAFKMAIREVAGRWYLYTGHFWEPGWSILDVTDPAGPEVVNFIPGPKNTWTLHMELSGDTMVTALERVFPNFGGKADEAFEEGVLIWDTADPIHPKQLGHFRTHYTGTHRNGYPGGRYVHLAAGMPGYKGNIYVILDISDRSNPVEAGRWWVPGQEEDGSAPAIDEALNKYGAPKGASCVCDGVCARATHFVSLHGPAYVDGDLVYLPYGAAGLIVLDISDVRRPRKVGQLSFSPPFHAQFGVHGVLPIPNRKIAFVNSEDTSYGKGPAHHASIVDISDPSDPWLLSVLPEPTPPSGAPYSDFHSRGGWCGPHNMNHHQHHPDVQKQGDLFYLAHFNAGLRVYNVSNPRLPREVGYFLPPEPAKRYGPMPEGKLVLQTEDVVVDRRGFIYISDKNQGIWVLRYVGE